MWEKNTQKRKNWAKWAKANLPYYCAHCSNTGKLELDHIINLKAGGKDETHNLQWLCRRCHNKKTQKEAIKSRNSWKKPKETHPAFRARNMPPNYYDQQDLTNLDE